MHSDFCNGHASILISLPEDRCTRVRDVIEVLSVLEDVYNHLYAWCLFIHEAAVASAAAADPSLYYPKVCSLTGLLDGIPEEERLCVAQMEVDPPAFVEITGGKKVLLAMRECLSKGVTVRESKRMDSLRREVDLLIGLNFSKAQIQVALSKHILSPLARLERLEGIRLYEDDSVEKENRSDSRRGAAAIESRPTEGR